MKLAEEKNKRLEAFEGFKNDLKCSIPFKYHNMTQEEIVSIIFMTILTTFYMFFVCFQMDSESVEASSKDDLLNITKSVKKGGRPVKRSASCADDEGKVIESVQLIV